ncbi:MAG: hypothetical protein ABI905_12155 [Betaproteobacteria bacterium]
MRTKLILALFFPVLLAACAVEPKRIETPPETRFVVQPALPSEADQLLAYATKMRKLEAREFAAERESARNQFMREKTDFNRIRYALLLAQFSGHAATSAQDDAELISVIEPVAAGAAVPDSDVRTLAAILYGVVNDRRKVREQLREVQGRLAVAKKEDTRDAEARALRQRVEELETKLNALKSIDRSVNRRTESPK